MLITIRGKSAVGKLKKQLSSRFEMKDLSEAKKVLSMEIERDRKRCKVFLTQKGYLKKILQMFNINGDTKSISTPLASHFKLNATMSPHYCWRAWVYIYVPYASAVGSLMYAMVCMRSYLSQTILMISRYMHDPGRGHWEAVKWILRYIKGTLDVGLMFEKDTTGKQECIRYVNFDYAGPWQALVYDMVCFYVGPSTDELTLYSINHYHFVYYGGRVYGHDGGYEVGNLDSKVAWLGDWAGSIEDQLW